MAHREVVHGYSDKVVDQHDTFVVVHTERFEIDTSGFTADEQQTVLELRWWSRDRLAATGQTVWPRELVAIWDLVDQPRRWPVGLPAAEESSVPA